MPISAHDSTVECEAQSSDEVSLIQLTNSVINRKKREAPADDNQEDVFAKLNRLANLASQPINAPDDRMPPTETQFVMGLAAGLSTAGTTTPPAATPCAPTMPPLQLVPGGLTTMVSAPAWVTTPPVSSSPPPMMPPGMGGGIGNITIVISPPLNVVMPPAPPPFVGTTYVPANMVVGYVPPTTGVPVTDVIGYVPAAPTALPMAMPPYPMPPAYPPPMPAAPVAYTAVPVSAYNAGVLPAGPQTGVPVSAYQSSPMGMMAGLLAPAIR